MKIVDEILSAFKDYHFQVGDIQKVITYLTTYGYLAKSGELSLNDVIEALTKFQEFFHLEADGKLTPQVLRAMDAPRCSVPDHMEREEAKWGKKKLTYYIEKYVPGVLTKADQQAIIQQAWDFWSEVADISASRVDSPNGADIIISIGTGAKDGFDGPSGTLAWAYLPNGSNSRLNMKYDSAETWIKEKTQRGILMLNVSCHEFGHLLGLEHSRVQSALMAPYYSPNVPKPQQNDDIPRIQALYGKPTTKPDPKPDPDPNPTDPTEPLPPGKKRIVIVVEGDITELTADGWGTRKYDS